MKRKLDPYTLRWMAKHLSDSLKTDVVLVESARLRGDWATMARYGWRSEWNKMWLDELRRKARALTKTPKSARKRNG